MSLVDKILGKKQNPKGATKIPEKKRVSEKNVSQKVKAEPKKPIPNKSVSDLVIPHITEKATTLEQLGQYIFKVVPGANKIDIAREIAGVYKVKVVSVNFINVPGKERKVGKTLGFRSGYKKAIVKLAKGQTIELK